MRKIFSSLAIFIFAWTIIFSSVTNAEGVWRLDGTDKNKLPRNFRVLEDLNSSASAEFSLDGLQKLVKQIKKSAPIDSKIYIVDLRQESHGFADGFPVSFYTEKNRGNFYIEPSEVEGVEAEQLKNLQGKLTEFVPLGNYDKKHLKPIKFAPKKTLTEREAVNALNDEKILYARFAATDMIFPAPEVVDEFLSFVNTLDKNSWLHFHCHAGHGRTTTFLVFYDILKNPDLSLEEICERQHLAGGSDLLTKSNGTDWYAEVHNDRAEKLKLFYKYAKLRHSGEIAISFSEFWQQGM